VNGCAVTSLSNTTSVPFPIGGANADGTCTRIVGCPDAAPVVTCQLPGSGHGSHDAVANPGFSTLIKLFWTPPLLTQ
jgi:hypothetical protein